MTHVLVQAGAFLAAHAAAFSLLVLAFIVTMREKLPPPFNRFEVFNWCYEWAHDALKTFVSFRSPNSKP